ncbi:hypothetical protein [Oryzicola mucosus]|uniref:Uncharacterized protein n=1 Tax=Oryzicola mucosus TaxID=2767425 RepID=A0A8J6PQY4_9HYPH|nr:hypothetical protein [Oryzicola mucosus]MBD0413459.1 hypothetical protein [Oryzicola mucosus]
MGTGSAASSFALQPFSRQRLIRAPALNEMVEVAAQLVAWSSPIGVAPE